MKSDSFVLVSCPLMHDLGDQICAELKSQGLEMLHHKMEFTIFANGEVLPKIDKTIRGQHVFFLHNMQHPDPNTAIMMMLIANDAMKRASVSGITLVLPYMSYLRQDRKDHPRVPITARLLADLIESNHMVKALITVDMHAEQEQGFFSIPVDNLTGVHIFSEFLKKRFNDDMSNVLILAPDFGGSVRCRRLAAALGDLPVAIFEKRRPEPNQTEIVSIIGESVKGRNVVMYEDMIDTGGTSMGVVQKVKEMGAKEVLLCATHGIFSRNKSGVEAETVFAEANVLAACSESISRPDSYYEQNPWLIKVSIAAYFASAIHEATKVGGSISALEN